MKSTLRQHRLVTILGPGGAGKTRLALETAYQMVRSYSGGCWFIDLGKHPAHESIVDHVASALRLTRTSGPWTVPELAARLDQRDSLLIVDNCEHVVDEVADLVHGLLRSTRNVDVLATSRQALGVGGEQLVHLDGLTLPPEGQADSPPDLAAFESVVLFIERGKSIVPDFDLTVENASAVADIVRRLDGLPLAIELAAARLRVLAPQQIASRLKDQFRLLRSSRSTDERHQTLRATIEWSYDLCSPAERLCWARLSVFPADFDLDAAESVASGDAIEPHVVLELVGALIDKSILRATPGRSGQTTRYRFTDPVRDFGREKLIELEPDGGARSRHLEHFSQVAAAVPELLFGPAQVERVSLLRTERPNLAAALAQALTEGQMDAADGLACAIALVSFASGSLSESFLAVSTVAAYDGNRSAARVRLLWLSAWIAINQGDLGLARQRATDCCQLAQLIGDQQGIVHAQQYLGECELLSDDIGAAQTHCRQAVHLAREINQDHLLATSLVRYAQVLEALGEPEQARTALAEAIAISDRVGEVWCRGYALWNLALLMQATGRPGEGVRTARAVLDSNSLFEDVVGMAEGLEVMAWCSADLGETRRAAVLMGAAEAVWTSSGAVLPARLVSRRDGCERRAVAELGAETYASLRQEGQALTPDQAVAWNEKSGHRDGSMVTQVAAMPSGAVKAASGAVKSPLTAREYEVALLVARGLKNREIAEHLVISTRTAEAHVEHILAKLGLNSRAQITSWAAYQADA